MESRNRSSYGDRTLGSVLGAALLIIAAMSFTLFRMIGALEERVAAIERNRLVLLESEIDDLREDVGRLMAVDPTTPLAQRFTDVDNEIRLFRSQVGNLQMGTFSGMTQHSRESVDEGIDVLFSLEDSALLVNIFSYMPVGDSLPVVLYKDGGIVDSFDIGPYVHPGDHVVAWYATEIEEMYAEYGVPVSPKQALPAFYWDSKTGLAITILNVGGWHPIAGIVK